ncbi:MAG TPA: hypothetical protein PKE20_04055 [Promineifilum sp.]|nr:hypothetical protein [Promineifilum sp.]
MHTTLSPRAWLTLLCLLMIAIVLVLIPGPVAAQDRTGLVQKISGRLEPQEIDIYLIPNLQTGDRLTVLMRATSGDLDPIVGIVDTALPPAEVEATYRAEIQRLMAESENVALDLGDLRERTFLAWNDDGGEGYDARLEFVVPAAGDYRLIAAASLSVLGRATSGDYELLVGLNAPEMTESVGEPFVEDEQTANNLTPVVDETTGTLTAENPVTTLQLAVVEAGETLYVSVEPVSGNLIPAVILRDFGGKPLQAGNIDGQIERATLEYTFEEEAAGYTLDILAADGADGTPTTGDFRALVGLNAPQVLTGQAETTDITVLKKPIEVQIGIRIERISDVDSQGEDFTVLGSIRMDWIDPTLAFSPDECNCAMKVYTEKEFDRFLADTQSRWPDFVFFNQQGNRWVQSRAAVIWPDGRARYGETFTVTYQADFDFRQFPFDTQIFPIYVDQLFPADTYVMTDLPGYSAINPDHGEDEFIISDFTTETESAAGRVADNPVSRFTLSFSAPRHQEYYVLQIFVPILLIMLISWFTFFLRDYTRRIEAAAANILLFIAFSFSLTDNYPRLGYMTFLDAAMAVTFIFNALVLLYNVFMKRVETEGRIERFEPVDHFLDWAYPLIYLGMIGIVVVLFFR